MINRSKKYLLVFYIIILIVCDNLYSQMNFGATFGGALPLGTVHETHQYGIIVGFSEVIFVKPPLFSLTAGQELSIVSAYSDAYMTSSTSFGLDDFNYFSIFLGPRFGNRHGLFFMSSLIFSMYTTETWMGFDIGIGYGFKSSRVAHTIDLTFKIRYINELKRLEYESDLRVIELNISFYI